MDSIVGKMTDEEGLFQGGEQGRVFGRILDLLGKKGKGVHDTIDRELSSSRQAAFPHDKGPDYMNRANMNALRQKFTEPSRFVELLKGMHPDIAATWEEKGNPPLDEYAGGLGSWDYERPAAASPRDLSFYGADKEGEAVFEVDDIMRAILGQQYGEHTEEKPYRTKRPYSYGFSPADDYHDAGMQRIMKPDPDSTKPQIYDEFQDKMVDHSGYGDALIPKDITDIVKIIQGLPSEYDEWIDEKFWKSFLK